jgi:hypothetical protein
MPANSRDLPVEFDDFINYMQIVNDMECGT